MGIVRVLMCVAVLALGQAGPAEAQSRTQKLNQTTLGVIAAEYQWLPQTLSVATAVQHDEGLRVLPIAGAGTVQTVADLALLENVDAAVISLDTLTYAQAQGLLQGLSGKLTYVARLQSVSWALVAPKAVNQLQDLSNKRIATGPTGTSGFVAGELLLNGHDVPFTRVPRQGADGLSQLTQGKADAALVDAAVLRTTKIDGSRFHVVPLTVPATLSSTYAPAMLTAAEVPALIGKTADVESVAAPLAILVLSGKGKATEAKLKLLASALFRNAASLKLNTNIAADIPGFTRHKAAAEVLKTMAAQQPPTTEELSQGDGQ